MRKNDLVFILATLKYPQTILQAAVSWNTEMGKARVRLRAGKNRGYLFEKNGHYSPTPELLQAWLAEGVLI